MDSKKGTVSCSLKSMEWRRELETTQKKAKADFFHPPPMILVRNSLPAAERRPNTANTDLIMVRNPLKRSANAGSAATLVPSNEYLEGEFSSNRIPKRVQPMIQIRKPSKVIPKNIMQDKEALYDTVMKLKEKMKDLIEENCRLKAKVNQTEDELSRKDKVLSGVMGKINAETHSPDLVRLQKETHLIATLKQKVKDLEGKIAGKDREITDLKKNIKITKLNEYVNQLNIYEQECVRLRELLKQDGSDLKPLQSELKEYKDKLEEAYRVLAEKENEIKKFKEEKDKSRPHATVKKVVKEPMIKETKEIIRVKLIEHKMSWEQFANKLFHQYELEETISVKEITKLLQGSLLKLTLEESEKLARYLVEPSDLAEICYDPYRHCLLSEVKTKFSNLMRIAYSFNETEFEQVKANALNKLQPHLQEIIKTLATSATDLDSINLTQWNEILVNSMSNLTELENDVLLYLAFLPHQNINALSLHALTSEEGKKREFRAVELEESSIKIMMRLTKHIYENQIKLFDLFQDCINPVQVNSTKGLVNVSAIPSSEFFAILKSIKVTPEEEDAEHEDLKKALAIGPGEYAEFIQVKKLQKAIHFFATDPEMRAKAEIYFEMMGRNEGEVEKLYEKEVNQGNVAGIEEA